MHICNIGLAAASTRRRDTCRSSPEGLHDDQVRLSAAPDPLCLARIDGHPPERLTMDRSGPEVAACVPPLAMTPIVSGYGGSLSIFASRCVMTAIDG